MSDENKGPFHYDPFFYDDERGGETAFPFDNSTVYSHHHNDDDPPPPPSQTLLQGFNPFSSSHMSFTDCLRGSMDYTSLSRAFDMSCSSSSAEVVLSPMDHDSFEKGCGSGTGENSATPPRSSLSSSSTEAAADGEADDPVRCKTDGDDKLSDKVYVFFLFLFSFLKKRKEKKL